MPRVQYVPYTCVLRHTAKCSILQMQPFSCFHTRVSRSRGARAHSLACPEWVGLSAPERGLSPSQGPPARPCRLRTVPRHPSQRGVCGRVPLARWPEQRPRGIAAPPRRSEFSSLSPRLRGSLWFSPARGLPGRAGPPLPLQPKCPECRRSFKPRKCAWVCRAVPPAPAEGARRFQEARLAYRGTPYLGRRAVLSMG